MNLSFVTDLALAVAQAFIIRLMIMKDDINPDKIPLYMLGYFAVGCFFISIVEDKFRTVVELSASALPAGGFIWLFTFWFVPESAAQAGYTMRKHYAVSWLIGILIMLKMRYGLFS